MSDAAFIFVIFCSALVCGFVGRWAGNTRDRGLAGFWLGFFFGPLGWITVLLVPPPMLSQLKSLKVNWSDCGDSG
jgi:hypothetical protein